MKYLVIVESVAKAKKIESFLLGQKNDYIVKASIGHIRDLPKKNMGIDESYKPKYEITNRKVVKELRKYKKIVDAVIIASDSDREGEAIAWHLCKVLSLPVEKTLRIAFNEITKKAITAAISTPRTINMNVVNAQQSRRLLDRIVGYTISPVLWKRIAPRLSAGRVQSIVLKLIVEKEVEVKKFSTNSYFFTKGIFNEILIGELNCNLEQSRIKDFLNLSIKAKFTINNIVPVESLKKPPPPYTTSALQQDACSKLHISPSFVMKLAQKLYEVGKITYHRTDSTALSSQICDKIKQHIITKYGNKYYKFRVYKTKSKNAQEAHEAIRPTNITVEQVGISALHQKLYTLIRNRTIASQMKDARYFKEKFTINSNNYKEYFCGCKSTLIFNGYLVVYGFKSENKKTLPFKNGNNVSYNEIECAEKYTQPPPRYSESSLVKMLERLEIGRPSTYAPIISRVTSQRYAEIEDIKGEKKKTKNYKLTKNKIVESNKIFLYRNEKKKFVPTAIGVRVCDFLKEHYVNIMDYKFTSELEQKLDAIAKGEISWRDVVRDYCDPIKKKSCILKTKNNKDNPKLLEGYEITQTKYGFSLTNGIKRINLPKTTDISKLNKTIIEDWLSYPKVVGSLKEKPITLCIGSNGKYITYESLVINVEKEKQLNLEKINAILDKKLKKIIAFIDKDTRIMQNKGNAFILYKRKCYNISKDIDPHTLNKKEIMTIIRENKKYK